MVEEDPLTLLFPQMVPLVRPVAVAVLLSSQVALPAVLATLVWTEVQAAEAFARQLLQRRALLSIGPMTLQLDVAAGLRQVALESPSLAEGQAASSPRVVALVRGEAPRSLVVARM